MADKAINIGKIHARLEDFWKTDKYTDVTIICENEHFKCHRLVLAAACKYFDAMFVESRFRESVSENIHLPEMSAEAFEQVLLFIYSGDARIDSKNVLSVLQASEFLDLPGIEDLCIKFLKADGPTVQDTLTIFMFACATAKESLIHLLSLHVANHFEVFSKIDGFLEIPFNDLRKILSRFAWSSIRNEETLLSAITRWIQHKREERLQYVQEFVQMIRFENISSTYIQYMFTKFLLDAHHAVLIPNPKTIGYSENSVLQVSGTSQTVTSLHVFVQYHGEKNSVKVCSINGAQVCSNSEDPILMEAPGRKWIRNVALDNLHLYRLQYSVVTQSQNKGNVSLTQSFHAYPSVNTSLGLRLKTSPVSFFGNSVGLCALKNNIYAYYPCKQPTPVNHSNSSNFLNQEEITRGICAYNCEVDDWFPVPKMEKRTEGASITSLNNLLYLIGGKSADNDVLETGLAQTYDCREGIWQASPRSHYTYRNNITCCAMDGKVYAFSALGRDKFERFDPVAGRWETMPVRPRSLQKITCGERMVPYLDQLFVMGGFIFNRDGTCSVNLSIDLDIFDVKSYTWKRSSVLTESSRASARSIIDAVVFKS